MTDAEQVADFVKADFSRSRISHLCLGIRYPVKGDQCSAASQLGFAEYKGEDGGTDVIAGNTENQWHRGGIGGQVNDNFSGIVLASAMLIGIVGYGLLGPDIGIEPHQRLKIGRHDGDRQIIDRSQRNDI